MSSRCSASMLALALGIAAGACDRAVPPTDAASSGEDLVGTFNVSLVAPSDEDTAGHTSLVGKVYDGPSPSQLVWEEAMRDGDCQLLTPRAPFCPERCGSTAVCVEDDVCQAYPKALNAGTVRVSGVRTVEGDSEFELDPVANTYQPRATIKLPFPAFSEGDRIRLRATGAELAAFELEARGISPLVLSTNEFSLQPDVALELAWEPPRPDHAGQARVRAKLDISHHGGSKGIIACEFDDSGAAQLPAALVSSLLDLGVAGFPSLILTRESSGSANTRPGRVVLTIDSKVERYVSIEGLHSCTDHAECPQGQRCQTDLTCR